MANTNIQIPCICTRDIIVQPHMSLRFDVSRNRSLASVKDALESGGRVFLTAQLDPNVNDPDIKDVYKYGTVCEIQQIMRTNDNIARLRVEGISKAKLVSLDKSGSGIVATVKPLPDFKKETAEQDKIDALCRVLHSAFETYLKASPKPADEFKKRVDNASSPLELYEALAFNIPLPAVDRQEILEAATLSDKLTCLLTDIIKETQILAFEAEIHSKVGQAIEQSQRDYYLREELAVIKQELGEDDTVDETYKYLEKISALGLPETTVEKLVGEANKLAKMPSGSQEAAVIRTYLDTVLELPWNEATTDVIDIKKVKAQLDNDHYGLEKVKERILELLAVRSLTPDVKGQIICLVGPPGVGKTSIGRSIATALGRKYARVSLGGVKDESDIRGHRKTYIGAMPGRIITAMKQAGTKNPLLLLDEIDKMSNDFRGDPSSAMLEVLDSEQNTAFRDHYIEVPFDLSDVLFITTANDLSTVSPPLLDRMDIIELPSYTREEKFEIAKRHLVPKQLKKNGLNGNMLRFTDSGLHEIIDHYTREAGVRTLERTIATLCRKAAKAIVSGETGRVTITGETVEKYLGIRKYSDDLKSATPTVGEVNGLAWTSVGGTLMPLEVLSTDGKGKIELTGSLGDVMKESAKIAISYTRSIADKYGIDKDFYLNKDIHIHAPEGAVPKDGPSAGVTMATAIISELSGIPVRSDVAMTGEITLRGKVLPIGGLREKTMAAYKAGIKTVIIPEANRPNLEEVDDKVKANVEFVFAKTLDDVFDVALTERPAVKKNIPEKVINKTKTPIGVRC